jgi:hypothetical protein
VASVSATNQEKYSSCLCPYDFHEPMVEIYYVIEGTPSTNISWFYLNFEPRHPYVAVYKQQTKPIIEQVGHFRYKESSITLATLVTSGMIVFLIPDKIRDCSGPPGKMKSLVMLSNQRLTLNITIFAESMNFCLNSYIHILPCKRSELFDIILCGIN